MKKYPRITVDPQKMGGVPCIRDLRMPIATILAMMAEGYNVNQILNDHPELEKDDINEVLRYAAEVLRFREIPTIAQ
ncbi:MAG TPA: DUF433 domain-containing protein [Ignavibacteriaceae bacterium]